MKYVKSILFSVVFAVAGVALYAFVLQKMCWSPAFYCGIYNALAALITAYGNFVMQFVRPECAPGGPDDCIAQALSIMLGTLLVIGGILGCGCSESGPNRSNALGFYASIFFFRLL